MPTDFLEKQNPPHPPLNEQVQQALRAPEAPANNPVLENFGQKIVRLMDDVDFLEMRSGLNPFLIDLKKATFSGDETSAAEIVKKIESAVNTEKTLREAHPTARGPYSKW